MRMDHWRRQILHRQSRRPRSPSDSQEGAGRVMEILQTSFEIDSAKIECNFARPEPPNTQENEITRNRFVLY